MLTAPLPSALEDALAARVGGGRDLAATSADLTRRYRDPDAPPRGPVARGADDVRAYAAARLPATYAATRIALGELRLRAAAFAPQTQLDLGAGPGTALWAAAELWSSLARTVAVEAEPAMAQLGRELVPGAEWVAGAAPSAVPRERFDLVTLTYLLGELEDDARTATIDRAWDAAAGALVVVEPGTPPGYRRVIDARDRLIARGGTVVAPCPHDRECPLLGTDDWCHFAVRVARSSAHRLAKDATLGHEDEKFSYVALVRDLPREQADARVLRHPQLRPGHVVLELCATEGLRRETVSKRDAARYRRARKIDWGEDFYGDGDCGASGGTSRY